MSTILVEAKEKGAALQFKFPDGVHQFGVVCYTSTPETLERFRELCREKFFSGEEKSKFEAFWQGESKEWIYVEFLTGQTPEEQDTLLATCEELASAMGLELNVD